MRVVIELEDGVVLSVYADEPDDLKLTVVNWDDLDADQGPDDLRVKPMSEMPGETRLAVQAKG